MEITEIKEKLESRLAYINREIELTEASLQDPILKLHNEGYLRGLNGTVCGQKKWLENLIKEIG